MAQPSPYNRLFNFSNFQSENPTVPLPAGSLDGEYNRIKVVLDQIRASIKAIQRDDFALANATVGYDQLKSEVSIGVNPPSTWQTATNYIVRDSVFHEQKFYVALGSHISGTFESDLAIGRWELVADFSAAQVAELVSYDNTESGLAATNMQSAMDELVESVLVTSVFGRSGAIVATAGDYTATKITFTPAGTIAATNVQAALAEVDGDITALAAAKANTSHTHAQSDVTNLVSDLAAKAPTSRTVSAAGLASGGGDLSANRTITVTAASQAEAEAGAATTVSMTPQRTAQAISALAKAAPYTGSSTSNVTFPIGTQVLVQVVSPTVARNGAIVIKLDAGDTSLFRDTGAGATLTGTWRSRGTIRISSNDYVLAERTA